jgi:hypothetical protein
MKRRGKGVLRGDYRGLYLRKAMSSTTTTIYKSFRAQEETDDGASRRAPKSF